MFQPAPPPNMTSSESLPFHGGSAVFETYSSQ
jgi:hypothetical protein